MFPLLIQAIYKSENLIIYFSFIIDVIIQAGIMLLPGRLSWVNESTSPTSLTINKQAVVNVLSIHLCRHQLLC